MMGDSQSKISQQMYVLDSLTRIANIECGTKTKQLMTLLTELLTLRKHKAHCKSQLTVNTLIDDKLVHNEVKHMQEQIRQIKIDYNFFLADMTGSFGQMNKTLTKTSDIPPFAGAEREPARENRNQVSNQNQTIAQEV